MTKPILIFDGACNFCRRWILRWQQSTGDRVDYAPFQEVGGRYPQISKEQFETSVQLMEPDGGHYRGVEAVFRTLAYAPRKRWMIGVYRTVPGVRLMTEWFYRLVASHRVFFSFPVKAEPLHHAVPIQEFHLPRHNSSSNSHHNDLNDSRNHRILHSLND